MVLIKYLFGSDNVNDVFSVFANPQIVKQVNSLRIFNRWGQLVFESGAFVPSDGQEASVGWDGTRDGNELDSGVFIYVAEVEYFDDVKEIYRGDITLLK